MIGAGSGGDGGAYLGIALKCSNLRCECLCPCACFSCLLPRRDEIALHRLLPTLVGLQLPAGLVALGTGVLCPRLVLRNVLGKRCAILYEGEGIWRNGREGREGAKRGRAFTLTCQGGEEVSVEVWRLAVVPGEGGSLG